MKKIFIICVVIIYICLLINNCIYAKYNINEQLLIGEIDIDKTSPQLQVEYINEGKNSVIVQIKSNEKINKVEGWNLNEDETILIKTFFNKTEEVVQIEDLYGNKQYQTIKITDIK